jgi:hypothetical protein
MAGVKLNNFGSHKTTRQPLYFFVYRCPDQGYSICGSPEGGPWAAVEPRSGDCQRAKQSRKPGRREVDTGNYPKAPPPPKPSTP